jgi:ferredoxin
MTATARVDRERCMGTGLCRVAAPKIFDMDASGHSFTLRDRLDSEEEIEVVRDAVESCPLEAISLVTDG